MELRYRAVIDFLDGMRVRICASGGAALEGSTATEKAALAKKLGAVAKSVEKQLWATLGVYP